MAPIIAFLISLGVIFSASEATPELKEQYQEEFEVYQEDNIVATDMDGM